MGLFGGGGLGGMVTNIVKRPFGGQSLGAQAGWATGGPFGAIAGYNIAGGKSPWANPGGGGGDAAAAPGAGDFAGIANSQYPGYQAVYDAKTMSPENNATMKPFLAEATQTGPSNWLRMAGTENELKASDAMDRAKFGAAGETAGAHDMLAATGGISSGARERVQEQGQKDASSVRQDVAKTKLLNQKGLMTTDAANHLSMLSQLPQIGQVDVGNRLTEGARKNDYNMRAYEAKMQALAAERQAQATENAGGTGLFGGKGFLGLGI